MTIKNVSLNRALIGFYDLSEKWQIEAISNHDSQEIAEEQTYIEPLKSHYPSRYTLHDLSEAMQDNVSDFHAVITVSNCSAIGLVLSDCGDSCDMHFLS